MKYVFLLSVFLLSSGETTYDWLTKSGQKRLKKSIEQIWPEQEIVSKEILIAKDDNVSFKLSEDHYYTLHVDAQLVAYLCITTAPSKFDVFDYAIFFNTNLSVKHVALLVYREDYGAEIGSKRWLKQFVEKSPGQDYKVSKEVDGISGATISVRSMTNDINLTHKRLVELREKGII
ncbi:MAG: FMN-binding protein [Bacteroidetes bacterium]|nr:FMN-binding protein [Bacteroidota bacterium]